ncbi:carbohydrate ABC transporter permease [Paenibacillus sp. FJAT-26967]|uniref:carbohydrate ABC transporter permease n=1 Tax=Paenibacillus sp. FJAT-26967 TaxID=1729690 RepID=UPI0020A4B83D|nr:sugar ABC transporter permease [Paenibacillus sp. FJAT-26967]
MLENVCGYVFITPMLIGVTIMTLLPIIASFFLSFTDWNFLHGFKRIDFIGLRNFERLFADSIFWQAMKNNLIFMLVVPATLALSLLLAVIINKYVYFKDMFKVIYFMPYISSVVAVAMVWQVLFHPSYGPVNQMLMSIGISDPPKWIADVNFALPSIMMIMIWVSIGYNLIIYIAGLQSIPAELYEAAEMDGAKPWQQFRSITLPMLSPTTFFLLITGLIGTFKVFDLVQVLTGGGPANSTTVVVFHLYETAFVHLKMGYASTMALVLFVTIFLITLIQWYGQRKWVNY